MISICAVIATRNEAPYLKVLLPLLASQGIDVAILDNGSSDGSQELYAQYTREPVVLVQHLPYRGYFSLTEQLEAKQQLYGELKHDWVMHHDADEIFESRETGKTLRDTIQTADDEGFNALNFDEFVFLPEPGADYLPRNYYKEMLRYYFFAPGSNRKNAAWKRTAGLSGSSSGGHTLSGAALRIWPANHIFRHYLVLSYEHAKTKYLGRSFDPKDLTLRWHGNRRSFTEQNLRLPTASPYLFQLDSYDSKNFCQDVPSTTHYWEWK